MKITRKQNPRKVIASAILANDKLDNKNMMRAGNNRYIVKYNSVDTSPEADAVRMFNEFKFTCTVSNPYDDAEYVWCRGSKGVVNYYKSGRRVNQTFYLNADDMDVENDEWCDVVIQGAIDELVKYNDKIDQRIIHNNKTVKGKSIKADDEVDEENEELETGEQEFTSERTSINSTKLPAIYSLVNFPKGSVVIDFGGGKFDIGTEYLEEQGCEGYIYDPYNRSSQHNRNVLKALRSHGGADIALCSNVLNVIKELEARIQVLKNIAKITKPSGKVYITVYEGSGNGNEGATKSGYQLNRKTADYLEEIQSVFSDAKRKGKLIIATNSSSVTSSEDTDKFNQFMELKSAYKNMKEFKDIDKDSTAIRDLTDELDHKGIEWSEYKHKNDKGVTIFYAKDLDNVYSSKHVPSEIEDPSEIDHIIYNAVHSKLKEPEFGFEDDKEIDQYSKVEGYYADSNRYVVEVRAELDYEGMETLMNYLDSIVEKFDDEAYFDFVAPGIIEAVFILEGKYSKDPESIKSATEPSLDPPEDSSWDALDNYQAVIDLVLDAIIFVDDTGNWEYEDNDYPWAKSDSKRGDWYDEENNVYLGSKVDMVEKTDDLLLKYIPERVGTYHISGDVKLVFDISGVEEKVTDSWYDENHGYDYDSEINTDFADVNYVESKSEIQNFHMQPVDE